MGAAPPKYTTQRHAKAGEVMERFAQVVLLGADGEPEVVPTYRGLGLTFG